MIQFTKSYKTNDGQIFGTIEEAQAHEIAVVFEFLPLADAREIASAVLKNKTILIDILTTTPNSKPKARSVNGGSKKRKKMIITDAATSITNTELNCAGE